MLGNHRKAYLGFPCARCTHPIKALSILAELPTPAFEGYKEVRLICPSCGHEAAYHLSTIRRFEDYQVN